MADTAVALRAPTADAVEAVLIQGDLAKLNTEQRNEYYMRVCHSVGLNPLTQPFAYIVLNGKLTLYAKRDATDQLRALHDVSVVDATESEREGVYIVTTKVRDARGRTDISKGAVNIANLKGEALANAMMKAETKAKRRATLSICGLGLLDETEVETIPGAVLPGAAEPAGGASTPHSPPRQQVLNEATGRMVDPNSSAQLKKSGAWESFTDKVQGFKDARDADGLRLWFTSPEVSEKIAKWSPGYREAAEEEFDKAFDWITEQA